MGSLEKLRQSAKKYLEILSDKVTNSTWDKGYYLSDDKQLRELEEGFIKEVPKYEKDLFASLNTDLSPDDLIHYSTLMGWAVDRDRAVALLSNILEENPNHEVHNYAARSLFPLVGIGTKINPQVFVNLLKHDSPYCKNKALGCLWAMPWNKSLKEILEANISLLQEAASSPDKIVNRPAQFVLNRIKNKEK